ncbi:MAG: hypothetical protein J6C84_10040 [Lachnospiraceae bacterium]|nr:hypothetical protein [Lachnospiraceae bacterium]
MKVAGRLSGIRGGSVGKEYCNKGGTAYLTSLAMKIARDFLILSQIRKGENYEDHVKRRLR